MDSSAQTLSRFFHELGVLKILPRSGSFLVGIRTPDTVGEHVFRAVQMAFVLAEMEGGNGERSAFLVAVHDNGEARIGDINKVMSRYISGKKECEAQAFQDQARLLPSVISQKYQEAFSEMEEGKTIEAQCANDADLLECAFQAKEFMDQGHSAKQSWITNVGKALQTNTAQQIFTALQEGESFDWWQDIKKV